MLEAIQLTKHYGQHKALQDLNLHVQPGEIFCLLGANGAGKSTTISLFLNLIKPTSGTALVNGIDVTKQSRQMKGAIAYIPEQVMLYPRLTGMENLGYFSSLTGHKHSRPALELFLQRAGLPVESIHRRVGGYSKGMRQKVAIALALANDAKVLLLDEPTSGLDPQASNEFSKLIGELSQEGVAILMATHDLFRAKESATRIGIMKRGILMETLLASAVGHAELEQISLQHMQG